MRPWHVAIISLAALIVVVGLVFASERTQAQAGYITTVAGSGPGGYSQGGYSGDGGPATSARLADPKGVALDSSGNLYIGDNGNSRIRMVNTSGIIITVAGNGTYTYCGDGDVATEACLWNPFGVALDSSGNLYIADLWNGRIRKVVPGSDGVVNGGLDEIITTVAGGGSGCTEPCLATDASLGQPESVAVDSSGNVYIGDQNNNRARKVDASGVITTVAGDGTAGYSGDGGPATEARLDHLYGVALDASETLHIADSYNHRIRKVEGLGPPVGGIAELPEVSGSSGPNYVPLAGLAAAALLAVTAGAWYARRRWAR